MGQTFKLKRNTCFREFKSSLALNFLSKNVNFNLLSFKRSPYDNNFCPISLGDLNVILGAWNGFAGNCCESCDQLFFQIKIFENTAFGHVTEFPTCITERWSRIRIQKIRKLRRSLMRYSRVHENICGFAWPLEWNKDVGMSYHIFRKSLYSNCYQS